MCGITGLLHLNSHAPVDSVSLRRMANAIAHRGPDADGFWTAPGVGLAHRRLAIIDLATGAQPMASPDGSLVVTFNGEIYNYREIRRELEGKGRTFRTTSDTEVLLHLYELVGDELVHRLRGMFAFGLWDNRRQRLLLGRDRIGQKPLYYYRDSEKLLFASEIKSILAWPGVNCSVDVEALEDYLTFGVVPGERSIFREIRKLPPAHTLAISRDNPLAAPRRYWGLDYTVDDSLSEDQWQEAIEAKFRETVAAHKIADVPVGAFLSGGLDSSAITGALVESGASDLQTFSIGFQEAAYSELPYARQVARQFGTRHTEEIVTAEVAGGLDDLVKYYDEPFADPSAIPTMCVARVAKQFVKVVLSGDGGDEAFGGYARYAHDLKEAIWRRRIPGPIRSRLLAPLAQVWPKADWLPRRLRLKTALTNVTLDDSSAYANTLSICRPQMRRRLLHTDVARRLNGHRPEERIISAFGQVSNDALRGMISADIEVLLPDVFLTKVDRASMAVGLEVRPPMVDHEFLELTARMPSRLKVRRGETKWLFKKMCDGWLPADVVRRPKQGFDIPVDDWLRGPLRDQFHDVVLSPTATVGEYINQPAVASLFHSHERRTGRHGQLLWALLVLSRWMHEYVGGGSNTSSARSGPHHIVSTP